MLTATNGEYYRNGVEITAKEYNRVLALLRQKPSAPYGYGYRFTNSDEWELYEFPAVDDDPELTEAEALEIILGGAV